MKLLSNKENRKLTVRHHSLLVVRRLFYYSILWRDFKFHFIFIHVATYQTRAEEEGRLDGTVLQLAEPLGPGPQTLRRRSKSALVNNKENLVKSTILTAVIFLIVTMLVLFFPHSLKSNNKSLTAQRAKMPSTQCNQSCKYEHFKQKE